MSEDIIDILKKEKIKFKITKNDYIKIGVISFMKTTLNNYGLFKNEKFIKTIGILKLLEIIRGEKKWQEEIKVKKQK